MSNEPRALQFITDDPDYRHLSDRVRFKAMYDEVGTLPANQEVRWRVEWMAHFQPRPNSRILELGAHNGPNLLHYGRAGHRIDGVELSDTLRGVFAAHVESEPAEVRARLRMFPGWIEELEPDGLYDYVLLTEVLEHVADPLPILRTARKALAPAGLLYISTPSTLWGNNTHVRGVPPETLRPWLREVGLEPSMIWSENNRTFCLAHQRGFRVIGLLRVRNEAEIIVDALDSMSAFCSGGIFVYDDCSSDDTVARCRQHPAVRDVLEGPFWDANRGRADSATRAALLEHARRHAGEEDWFVYLDADERVEFDWSSLVELPAEVAGIRMKLYDFYITPEDVNRNYRERRWLGPEYRSILIAFRHAAVSTYEGLDQREVTLLPGAQVRDAGSVRHYGKAGSVAQWESACNFYDTYFRGYAAKWRARRGQAVHTQSDWGMPLIEWHERETKGTPLERRLAACAPQPAGAPSDALRILLTNHHLLDFTGSETVTITLATVLARRGHHVVVYSRHLDRAARRIAALGVRIVDDLGQLADERFDVAHVHHNINAIEVREAFPGLPIVFLSHGVLPFLEQAPMFDVGMSEVLAVSEEVRDRLIAQGVPAGRVRVFRNPVDAQKFAPVRAARPRASKALIISTRLDQEREAIIRAALDRLDIEPAFVGGRFGQVEPDLLPLLINRADVVFSLGRGVIEAMMCARIPFVYDYRGGDGLVTPENVAELMTRNFSGRSYQHEYTVDSLTDALLAYRADDGLVLRRFALEHFDADSGVDALLQIYRDAMAAPVPSPTTGSHLLHGFAESISEAARYGRALGAREAARMPSSTQHAVVALTEPVLAVDADTAAELRDLLWIDDSSAAVHRELGVYHQREGRFDQAFQHLRRAVALDPADPASRCALDALIHANLGYFGELSSQVSDLRQQLTHAWVEVRRAQRAHAASVAPFRAEELWRSGTRELWVYGAGDIGQIVARACAGAGIGVRGFIDRDASRWGTQIEGVTVCSLDEALATKPSTFVIGSMGSVDAIADSIWEACPGSSLVIVTLIDGVRSTGRAQTPSHVAEACAP